MLKKYLIAWLGFATCVALLLPNHYSPWLSFHQEVGAALAFGPLLIWAVWAAGRLTAMALAGLLLAAVPMAQIASGQLYFAGDGWMAALYLTGFALAVSAGFAVQERGVRADTVGTPQTFDPLWSGLVLAGLVSVAVATHQWLMLGRLSIFVVDMPPNARPFANLAQPNHLATALLLALVGLVSLAESNRIRPMVAFSSAVLLVFGLLMTGSRSVLLAIAWIVPAYFLMRRRCMLRTHPAVLLGLVALYLGGTLLWPSICDALLVGGGQNAAINRMNSLGIRSTYWISMLDALALAPWLGYGWGQAGLAQSATALEHAATHTFFESSHNIALDLTLWSGVPIALCVSAAFLAWLVWQFRSIRSAGQWAMLMALCMVLSHAMVEYPLHYAYFLLPVGLWIGALTAASPSRADRWVERHAVNLGRPLLAGAALAAGVLFALVVRDYLPYEEDWRLMQFQEAKIGDPQFGKAPPVMLLDNLHALLAMSRAEARPAMTPAELDIMRTASQRYAYPSLMYKYARALALNGSSDGAGLVLAKLCKMHPVHVCTAVRREWTAPQNWKPDQLPAPPWPVSAGRPETDTKHLEPS